MSFDPPPAVLRVALCHLIGGASVLKQDSYEEADRSLRAAGWIRDDDRLCAPTEVAERCADHHEWSQFVETWGKEEDLPDNEDPNAGTVYLSALYMFAHRRDLL